MTITIKIKDNQVFVHDGSRIEESNFKEIKDPSKQAMIALAEFFGYEPMELLNFWNGAFDFDNEVDDEDEDDEYEDEDYDFLSDLANEAVIDEMCSSWIGQLLERLDKDSIEELTIEDLRDEIEEMHGTIENESILIGVSEFAEENIEHFEAYIEYLEALIEEKEEHA